MSNMYKSTEDRRIRRTKRMLQQALAKLMSQKEFKDITVKDITDLADLNRSTFYLHYEDTYDLLEKVENEMIGRFEEMVDDYHSTPNNFSVYKIVDQAFDYLEENMEICRPLFLSNTNSPFLEKLMNVIIEKGFTRQKEVRGDVDPEKLDYQLQFLAYGIVGALRKWFQEEGYLSKEQIVNLLDQMITGVMEI